MAKRKRLDEETFKHLIMDHLEQDDGYIVRDAKNFDAVHAMDVEMFFEFLERTQPETLERLHAIYNGGLRQTILARVANEIAKRGLIQAIWDGVPFDGADRLNLVHPRPSATFDTKALKLYDENKLYVMEEVYHKEGERIDLVILLNGLAIFTLELKCESSGTGWDYREAIRQYKEDRDSSTRLLMPKVGALAHFAMDLNEVWVCAALKGRDSKFLPFNQGIKREGSLHETEAGNPLRDDGPATAYMWEDILTKDTVFDLIYDFVYLARDKKRKKPKAAPIFPRFQQLRAVRRVTSDMAENGTMRDYLIEHSAGSGKTNTIGWLAHKLSALYPNGGDAPLFKKVLIVTDRIVIDRQLQDAVLDMAKDPSVIKVIDSDGRADESGETSKSGKLAAALTSGYRIVVCTMGSFLNLKPGTFAGTDDRFAVLIDEAHGSTSGETMKTLQGGLSAIAQPDEDNPLDAVSDFLAHEIALSGRPSNVSAVGFTATPTARTLQRFGTYNKDGKKEAFDLYSMRQAIQEKFIIDVTSNYTTYDSYCTVLKSIEDDPEFETSAAKRALAHFISVSDGTIKGNLAVMVDHFITKVAPMLGKNAKAMIVTSSREAAVRYRLAYDEMRAENPRKLGKYQALVAFSGDITVDGKLYTERSMNGGLAEEKLPLRFAEKDFRILIVADKYQTGFDQPFLAAMYVDKHLSGLTAVQTLSRLNRICPPYEKRTFVLDFKNDYESIQAAFAPYYENTILENPLTYADLKTTEQRLLELDVLDYDDIEEFYSLVIKPKPTGIENGRMWALLGAATRRVQARPEEEADEARYVIRNFIRQYTFLLMASPFEDAHMHKEYRFCSYLAHEIDSTRKSSEAVDLSDKVMLEDFTVELKDQHIGEELAAEPTIYMPTSSTGGLPEDVFSTLSEIIKEWNAKFGKDFDTKTVATTLTTLKDSLEDDEKIQQSAKVNTRKDFRNTVEDRTGDVLVGNYDKNVELYKFLLNNQDAQKQLVTLISDLVYTGLKQKQGGEDE